ncbi:phage tail protein [Rhizobium sp. AC27/96]|uniref:phage tail protein n=1 Tax=Rhizobium sp. AC27/96 TaxID=1841653 RepID=UPI0009F5ECC8|nr:phage tail protein [Rhizobium sp. AC27/96]
MKYLILLLNVLGFWLMADVAHADPISAAIAAIGNFIGSISIGKLVLTVAINIGLSLVEKALAKKDQPQPAGTKLEINMGDDHAMSFIIGSYATAGKRKYAGTWGDDGKTPNAYFTDVIEIGSLPNRAGPRGLTSVWIDDQKVGVLWDQPHPDGRGFPVLQYRVKNKDYLWIKFLDGTQTAPDPFLMAKFGTHAERPWRPTMIGRGCQVVILTSRYNTDLFKGVPAGLFEPHPLPLYDVRKDSSVGGNGGHRWSDPTTWQPSTNPAVMIYNLARGVYYGPEWVYGGQNIGAFCLPAANWMAAANACDASVPLDGGGSEPAYRAGYDVQCDQEPLDAVSELLKGCNGRMAEVGGIFKMLVGSPGGAVYSFTDDDVVVTEEQDFRPFPSLSATYNSIEATYPEPAEKWATKDAPGRYNADLEVQDGNRRLPAEIQLLAVPFANQVQRVGLAMIQDYRRFRVHQISLPPDAYPLEPNDVVSWSSARNGYDEKKFLVVKVEPQPNFLIVVTLKEVDPADYDWHPGLQLPTAIGWLGPITPPSQPMIGWTVEPSTIKDAGGIDRRPAIKISCAPDLDDVRGVWVQVRVKASGDVVFDSDSNPYALPFSWIISGQWTLPNTEYEVRGRYLPQSNRATDWSAWLTVKTPNVLIQASDVLDGAIVQSKIADAAVSAAKIMDEAVSNVKLANQAVSTAKLQVAAVTADVLASGAVISAKLADGAVTAAKLAQGAVDATSLASSIKAVEVVATLPTTGNVEGRQVFLTTDGKLYRYHNGGWTTAVAAVDVNGTLNGSQIADNAITSNKLAALAVDATKFASGIRPVEIVTSLPTTGNIAGRTVYLTTDGKLYRYTGSAWTAATAAVDVAGQMTDAQIAAIAAAKVTGTLISSQIADAAITNSKLAALAVDAAKLADNAITNTKIANGAISTPKLQANAITADKIAANTITANKMVLADFTNRAENPNFGEGDVGWARGAGVTIVNDAINAYTGNWYMNIGAGALANTIAARNFNIFPVVPGEQYFLQVFIKVIGTPAGPISARMRFMGADKTNYINNGGVVVPVTVGTSYAEWSATIIVPGQAVYAWMDFVPGENLTASGSYQIGFVSCQRKNTASLIVDGAITASKLAAGSVTTTALAAGSVTADDIATNAVTAGKIAAGAVTAGQIAAGAIGATQIAAKAITVDKLLVTNQDNQIDQGFSGGSRANWYAPNLGTYYLETGPSPAGGTYVAQCDGRDQLMVGPMLVRVSPGESYNFSVWFYNTDPIYDAFMGMYVKDALGASVGPNWVAVGSANNAKSTWTFIQANVTIPAGVYMIQPMFGVTKTAANGNWCYWARPNMRRASSAELIVDGAIIGSKVAANAITGDKIAANTITARSLVLQDWENLVPDNQLQSPAAWTQLNNTVVNPVTAQAFTSKGSFDYTYFAGVGYIQIAQSQPFAVVSGQEYLSAIQVVRTSGTKYGLWARIHWLDAGGNLLNPDIYVDITAYGTSDGGTVNGIRTFSAAIMPPTSAFAAVVKMYIHRNFTDGNISIGGLSFLRKASANLIVDGAITADKIAANAVVAGKIAANAITAGTIAANAVTAGTIATGAISASQIAAGSITADKLAAGSVSAQALAVGTGGNYLTNSDLSAGLAGWSLEHSNEIASFSLSLRTDTFAPEPGAIQIYQSNGNQGVEYGVGPVDAYGGMRTFAVRASGWYELSVYYFGHRCRGLQPYVGVFDAADNLLGRLNFGIFPAAQNFDPSKNLANYQRFWTKVQVPTNAAKARIFFRMKGTIEGLSDSYLWLARMYFGEASANQTEPTPWSDGSITLISNGNIATNVVTADKIAANAVTAGKIAASAVTAGTIAAGAVTATTITGGAITGDKLAANTIGAGQIAANAITAKQLVLTDFSNMADNGWQTGTLDGWVTQNTQAFYLDTVSGDAAGYVLQSLGRDCSRSNFVAVTVGETYSFDVWVYNTDTNPASIYAALLTPSGVWGFTVVASTSVKNVWVRLQGRYTVASGYTKLAMLLQVDKTAGTGNSCYWSKPVMRRAASAELIVDGAITANKIAANSITADKLNINSLDAITANIGNLQVGTSNIVGGAITRVDTGLPEGAAGINANSGPIPVTGITCMHGAGSPSILVLSSFSLSNNGSNPNNYFTQVEVHIWDNANNRYTAVLPFSFYGATSFTHSFSFRPPADRTETQFRFDVKPINLPSLGSPPLLINNRIINALTLKR